MRRPITRVARLALALNLLACGMREPQAASPGELARLEAARDGGSPRLRALAAAKDPAMRVAAARALGRIGGPAAAKSLRALLHDRDARVVDEAARAVGAAGIEEAAADVAALPQHAATVEALGRVGGPAELPRLVTALTSVPESATLALGRYGRRQISLSPEARAALVALAGDARVEVRYGVAYALAKEQLPRWEVASVAALKKLVGDADAEVRAVAILGLSARKDLDEGLFLTALDDDDWRVRVEAVRALSAPGATASMHGHLAAWLEIEWVAIADLEARLLSPRVHPVLEGLSRLAPFAGEPEVKRAMDRLYEATDVATSTVRQRYTASLLRPTDAVRCLAAAARVRAGGSLAELVSCGEPSGTGWPLVERRRLVGALIADGLGGSDRLAAVRVLWGDADSRVRAIAAETAAGLGEPVVGDLVPTALGEPIALIAAAAADGLAGRAKAGRPIDPGQVAALEARASRGVGDDPEARLSFLAALTAVRGPRAGEICRAALADALPAIRDQARACVTATTGSDPGAAPAAVAPPSIPVDPLSVIGKRIHWTVTTTKGPFEVELDGDAAPWNVATLVSLAQRGFYDKTVWHRVVPDFVVQGGDPTGSGMGGPGFVVPAEPSAVSFARGTVGIADAGKDTGGSQWFVMHTRAPHLDGRYTVVGRVTRGLEVVDSLVVGDSIVSIQTEPALR